MPCASSAARISAIEAEPGIPKAIVGTSEPPSFALFDDSDAITPRTSPRPKVSDAPLQVRAAWP